jgi:hypothetical protein
MRRDARRHRQKVRRVSLIVAQYEGALGRAMEGSFVVRKQGTSSNTAEGEVWRELIDKGDRLAAAHGADGSAIPGCWGWIMCSDEIAAS